MSGKATDDWATGDRATGDWGRIPKIRTRGRCLVGQLLLVQVALRLLKCVCDTQV